jgi:hypothetical protein
VCVFLEQDHHGVPARHTPGYGSAHVACDTRVATAQTCLRHTEWVAHQYSFVSIECQTSSENSWSLSSGEKIRRIVEKILLPRNPTNSLNNNAQQSVHVYVSFVRFPKKSAKNQARRSFSFRETAIGRLRYRQSLISSMQSWSEDVNVGWKRAILSHRF